MIAIAEQFVVITLAIGITGCASAQLRTQNSDAAICAAEALGAENVPNAARHLQRAKAELARAQALANAGDAEQGASMLMRAEADADLASALSQADPDTIESSAAVEHLRHLQASAPTRLPQPKTRARR